MAFYLIEYCNCRLMLRKLEETFPEGRLLPNDDDSALSTFLEIWTMETLFPVAAKLLPLKDTTAKDKEFLEDRQKMSGRSWKIEGFGEGKT